MSNKELLPFAFELDVKHTARCQIIIKTNAKSEAEAMRKIRRCISKHSFDYTDDMELLEDKMLPEGYIPMLKFTKKLVRREDYER